MRILLDANLSGKVAGPLRQQGHDVLAVAEHPELARTADEDLLKAAREQERVIVTFDVDDFVPLTTRYTATEDGHSGCILISSKSFRPSEFGAIARALTKAFEITPAHDAWQDRVAWPRRP